jgi:hypothetical protein
VHTAAHVMIADKRREVHMEVCMTIITQEEDAVNVLTKAQALASYGRRDLKHRRCTTERAKGVLGRGELIRTATTGSTHGTPTILRDGVALRLKIDVDVFSGAGLAPPDQSQSQCD